MIRQLATQVIWRTTTRDGGTQYERPYRDMLPTWVAKSAFWYMNDPLQKYKIWYMNGLIFQNWLKLRKFWKNQEILLTIWHKVKPVNE